MGVPVRSCAVASSTARRSSAAARAGRVSDQRKIGVSARPAASTPSTFAASVSSAMAAIGTSTRDRGMQPVERGEEVAEQAVGVQYRGAVVGALHLVANSGGELVDGPPQAVKHDRAQRR